MLKRYQGSVRGSIFLALSILFAPPPPAHGQVLTLVQTNSRFAGTGTAGFSGDYGSDTSLALNQPSFMVLDGTGNLFLADTANNCVRKIDSSGNMSTLAGLVVPSLGDTCDTTANATPTTAQGLLHPLGLALDRNNNLYIADSGHNCIRRLANNASGTANLVAVAGTCGASPAASKTPSPAGIVIDSASNLYAALQDVEISPTPSVYQVVRQSVLASATPSANAATLCLVGGSTSAATTNVCSGIANSVVLAAPSGLALDVGGNLFVADTGNNCVRQLTGNVTQTTIVGLCANDSTGTAATLLYSPFGLVFSRTNALFISETDASHNNIVRFLPATGTLSLDAGAPDGSSGVYTSAQDGTSALNITLNQPQGLLVDRNDTLYVADSQNSIIRLLSPNDIFPTTPVPSSSATQPLTFIVNQPANINVTVGTDYVITSTPSCLGVLTPAAPGAAPTTCQVFVRFAPTRPGTRNSPLTILDAVSNTLSAIGLQGIGTGALGVFAPGTVNTVASSLNAPVAVTTDSTGNAYVLEAGATAGTADLRVIPAAGGATTLAIPAGAGLLTPSSIATDAAGNWYIADSTHGTIARFGTDGAINTSFVTGLTAPSALYVDGFGNLYIAQQGATHNVIEVYASGLRRTVAGSGNVLGADNVAATTSQLVAPGGLFIDVHGVLYIADTGGHRVYAVDTAGLIHLLAGNGTTTTTSPGIALGTAIVSPSSIAVDAASDLYIADSNANRVYAVYTTSAAGNNIATVLGTGTAGNTGDGGPSQLAKVNAPLSVALDSSGNLFVVDSGNRSVREITYPLPTLAFGNVTVGTTSPVLTQYFSNTGTDPLNLLSAISTTDPHFAIDTATTTCGTSILPGSICAIGVKFTPTAIQRYIAYSNLLSNSYNSPEPIQLTGGGRLSLPVTTASPAETEVYGYPFPQTSTYNNGSNPAVTGTLTYSVNGVTTCSFTGTLSPASTCNAPNSGLPIGTYPVLITYSGDANYAPSTATTTLTVTPAPLSVVATSFTRPYGQPNPTLTGTITGLVNNDTITVTYATAATIASPIGKYPIVPTVTGAALSNYTLTVTNGTLTITAAVLSVAIVPNNATRIYGTPNPVFTFVLTGIVNNDALTVTLSTAATITSPVGTYPIIAVITGTKAGNYTPAVLPAVLTVTPAPTATVLATSAATAVSGTPITFTATVTSAVTAAVGAPPGTVSFYDGTTLLGTGTLNAAGIATYTTSTLSTGAHSITAAYPGTLNFLPSASAIQPETVSGTFTISATPPTALIRGAGQTIYTVTVHPLSGFTGPVALSCAGLPADATCAFAPGTVTLTANTDATAQMTVTTTAADAQVRAPILFRPSVFAPITAAAVLPFELGGVTLLLAGRRRRRSPRLLLAATLGLLALAGCGCPPTAFATYTITITGTSTAGIAPPASTSVQLSVGLAN